MTLATLREQRTLVHENMAWKKNLESMRAAQTRVERDTIVSKIGHLAPGLGRSRRPPPRQAPETPMLMDVARTAAALGEDSEVDVIPQVTKRKPRAPKKPVVKAARGKIVIDREAIRSQIQRVRVSSAAAPRGRGRPPGSLNKAPLARLQAAV